MIQRTFESEEDLGNCHIENIDKGILFEPNNIKLTKLFEVVLPPDALYLKNININFTSAGQVAVFLNVKNSYN